MKLVRRVMLIAGLGAALACPAWAGTTQMSVQVRNGQVRATPSFLGSIVAPVAYGERVTVVQTQGEWMKVSTTGGKTGWIHNSALSKKTIVMKAGDQNVQTGASGDELALAGKGFNSDVEAQFKANNKDVDFTWVDKMEKMKVSPEESAAFLKEGGLKPSEGGAP